MSNQVSAEQLIFGWVDRGSSRGYQLVTKSNGTRQDDLDYLQKHSLPSSLDNLTFRECRRLFSLPSGNLAFNYVKGIGKDAYGREGAIYSHFIVISPQDFRRLNKNFEMVDAHHLKGIASVKDLQRFVSGGNSVPLPAISMEAEMSPHKGLNSQAVDSLVFPLLQHLYDRRVTIMCRISSYWGSHSLIWQLERMFPPDLLVSYSTYQRDPALDSFITIGVTDLPLALPPYSFYIDLDSDKPDLLFTPDGVAWSNSFAIPPGSILYQLSASISRNPELYSLTGNVTPESYLRSVMGTFLKRAIASGEDMGMLIGSVFLAMEDGTVLSRDEFYGFIREFAASSVNNRNTVLDLYMKSIDEDPDTASQFRKIKEIFNIVLSAGNDEEFIERFAREFSSNRKLNRNSIACEWVARQLLNARSMQRLNSALLRSSISVYEQWVKLAHKEQPGVESLSKTLAILRTVPGSQKDDSRLIYEAIHSAIRMQSPDIPAFAELLIHNASSMEFDDFVDVGIEMAKTLGMINAPGKEGLLENLLDMLQECSGESRKADAFIRKLRGEVEK